ncbi:MAG: hypothetical protein HY985_07625 [Magnetospirillum sp.]|nr:hypothetical protein [Magnetospirillum sp.]
MIGLAEEEWVPYHRRALHALTALGQSIKSVHPHSAGHEYTSIMSSFLVHNVSAAKSLLSLCENMGTDWFPVAVGYGIARTIFEVDVTAHYIALEPQERVSQYILFEHILNKKAMDACKRHRRSDDPLSREAMDNEWRGKWEQREHEIDKQYEAVKALFTKKRRDGKDCIFNNWSGKNIRDLATATGHEAAYDIFYSKLSSFTHIDVLSANQFLRLRPNGLTFTQRATPFHVGEVLHDAASFLTCYLRLFGTQFDVWDDAAVSACWDA